MLENCTPMMAQYLNIKKQHQEEILFFRLGDFYEMFFDDAITASKELEIALTARDGGNKNKVPMCGVPYHAANAYIAKLVAKGFKVAICEQVQDPQLAKGIVEREVIRVITTGSFLQDDMPGNSNNYIAHVLLRDEQITLAVVDIFTGEFKYQLFAASDSNTALLDSLFKLNPVEIIFTEDNEFANTLKSFVQSRLPSCCISNYEPRLAEQIIKKHFGSKQFPAAIVDAVEYLLQYIHYILKLDFKHINTLEEICQTEYMRLDVSTLRNLELLKNTRDLSAKGSLFWVLDATHTNMGARRLRRSIEFPLLNIKEIKDRQQAVAVLLENLSAREQLIGNLKNICDIERIISKVELNSITPRDVLNLSTSLQQLPQLKESLGALTSSELILNMRNNLNLQEALTELLSSAMSETPPFSIKDGGVFKPGFSKELDELRNIAQDSDTWLSNFEQQQREQTGIRNLKVGYNKVFGYYIEVSKGNVGLVPAHFVRKQTLVNAERYIVEELKNFEDQILGSKERVYQLELALFEELRQSISAEVAELQKLAGHLGLLDMLISLAIVADKYNYHCPQIVAGKVLNITDGRHPVVERLLKKEVFVANNTDFAPANMQIITGPNMAGKSTYMRQVALICIMAQIGSFVPAAAAQLSPVEQIFTRVGASDDLATGQSTFMVEMQEVANILAQANAKSLIILDEVGRGTSTYDGISIARAVVEYIVNKVKAKTLFATHYHELIELENCLSDVKNYSVAIRERGKEIVFLRRIVAGGSDKSYGIHVAQLAGLPKSVLNRAEALVEFYSKDEQNACNIEAAAKPIEHKNSSAPDMFTNMAIAELLEYDVPSMTPLEALNTLYKIQEKFKSLR